MRNSLKLTIATEKLIIIFEKLFVAQSSRPSNRRNIATARNTELEKINYAIDIDYQAHLMSERRNYGALFKIEKRFFLVKKALSTNVNFSVFAKICVANLVKTKKGFSFITEVFNPFEPRESKTNRR